MVSPGRKATLQKKRSLHSLPWAPRTSPMAHSTSPTSPPKAKGTRLERAAVMAL